MWCHNIFVETDFTLIAYILRFEYSKIPILRPPSGLLKSGLISEVVLIKNTIL